MEVNDMSIVIGVLARDCADGVVRNKVRIEELRKFFRESHVVIVENDSVDLTKQTIADYAAGTEGVSVISRDYAGQYPFHYEGRPYKQDMSCMRIARMSFFRNILLDYIRQNYQSDYVMLLDIDLLDFSVKGIIEALSNAPEGWGALLSNGREYMLSGGEVFPVCMQYDTYSLLFEGEKKESIPMHFTSSFTKLWRGIRANRQVQRTDYYRVLSAFGGIGIYKMSAIKDLRYDIFVPEAWKGRNISICEHIPFNTSIIGDCYIARSLQTRYRIVSLAQKHILRRRLLLYFFIICKRLR